MSQTDLANLELNLDSNHEYFFMNNKSNSKNNSSNKTNDNSNRNSRGYHNDSIEYRNSYDYQIHTKNSKIDSLKKNNILSNYTMDQFNENVDMRKDESGNFVCLQKYV